MEDLAEGVGTIHAVLGLAQAFFSINISQETQDQFAFEWDGCQYTFTVFPQGLPAQPYDVPWDDSS